MNWDEMSPRERDALVATEVMGLNASPVLKNVYYIGGDVSTRRRLPHYTTDISAAWEVVEKMDSAGFTFTVSYGDGYPASVYFCPHGEVFRSDPSHLYSAEAETAPEAICLAALRAKGVDV